MSPSSFVDCFGATPPRVFSSLSAMGLTPFYRFFPEGWFRSFGTVALIPPRSAGSSKAVHDFPRILPLPDRLHRHLVKGMTPLVEEIARLLRLDLSHWLVRQGMAPRPAGHLPPLASPPAGPTWNLVQKLMACQRACACQAANV